VVAFHALQWEGDPYWIGAAGVDVFFVVSGFIIWRIASDAAMRAGPFIWRRLTRVAPSYWIATLATAALAAAWPRLMPQVSLSARHLALSLAFVQHTDPRGLVFPLLPPGWSLNYEAVFYLIVGGSLFAPARLRLRLVVAGLVGVVAFGFLRPPAYELGANPMMLQFAAGAGLATAERPLARLGPRLGAALTLAALALFAAMSLTDLRSELFRPLLWGCPATLTVAGAIALEPTIGRRLPSALMRLGDASYAIYLCHFPTVALVAAAMRAQPAAAFVTTAIAASLAVGLAFHRLVERPTIALSRALPARLRRTTAAAPAVEAG
jgi:exopolysaccharide production protein ExoZ